MSRQAGTRPCEGGTHLCVTLRASEASPAQGLPPRPGQGLHPPPCWPGHRPHNLCPRPSSSMFLSHLWSLEADLPGGTLLTGIALEGNRDGWLG